METKPASPGRNRRNAVRKRPRGSVRVQCRRGAYGLGPNVAVGLLDLSETGARLVIKEPLEAKHEVEITLAGYGMSADLKLPGTIAWAVRLENGHFAIGVNFQKRLRFCDVMQLTRSG